MKGKISIHRYQSNVPPYGGVHIEVSDRSSGMEFLKVDMTFEEFGNVMSGLGYVDCEFELRNTNLVGCKRESKEEKIQLRDKEFIIRDESRQNELLAPYEVDGWVARRSDLENHHKIKNNIVTVVFTRFVEPE